MRSRGNDGVVPGMMQKQPQRLYARRWRTVTNFTGTHTLIQTSAGNAIGISLYAVSIVCVLDRDLLQRPGSKVEFELNAALNLGAFYPMVKIQR